MKKFLYIIGFLMFSSVLFSPAISRTALGAPAATGNGTPGTQANCSFPWTSCLHVNIPDTDWSATFGVDDPAKAGQDLYKNILEMTNVSPDQKAFKNTAGAYGTTQSDMVRLVGGDFGPILDRNPYLSQNQAIQKMQEVQAHYQEEKDIFSLQSDINSAVTPNEIFEDGDTSNSGFDLINDLNNIENILFKKMDPIDVGGNYSPSTGGSAPTPANPGSPGNGGLPPANPAGSTPAGSSSSNGPGGGTGTGSIALIIPGPAGSSGQKAGSVQQPIPPIPSGLGPKPTVAENPNVCLGNNQIDQELNAFDSKVTTDSRFKETPTVAAPSSLNTSGSVTPPTAPQGALLTTLLTTTPATTAAATTAAAQATATAAATTTAAAANAAPSIPPVAAADAANWLKTPPCADILCVQINFVKTTAVAYTDSDNCIACHIEKIDAKLKETINHSLIPGKATGNLFEPGTCKQAGLNAFNANIRFYTVAKPIKTPTNDDLIYGTNAAGEWEKFVNTYKPFPFYTKNVPDPNNPKQDAFAPSVQDSATKAAIAYATPDTSIADVNRSIQQAVQTGQDTINNAVSVAEVAQQTQADSGFYQSIRPELEQMNFYFDSIQNIFIRINQQAGDLQEDHPCQTLPNIKQCT